MKLQRNSIENETWRRKFKVDVVDNIQDTLNNVEDKNSEVKVKVGSIRDETYQKVKVQFQET